MSTIDKEKTEIVASSVSVPPPSVEAWFAAIFDAEKPPRTFEEAVELGALRHENWRTLLPLGARMRVDWSHIDVAHPSASWWLPIDSASTRVHGPPLLHAVALSLLIVQTAMASTPGMSELVTRWVANRRRGSAADSNLVPLLPRESGAYRTTMTEATVAERETMAAYDAELDRLLTATEMPGWACVAAVSSAYIFRLEGFESRLTARTIAQLKALGVDALADTARRAALGMPTYHQFESPEIEKMTMESVADVAAANAANEHAAGRTVPASE